MESAMGIHLVPNQKTAMHTGRVVKKQRAA